MILKGEYEFPINHVVSNDAYDLIQRMLVKEKDCRRITLEEILQHPFVNNKYIPKNYTKELLLPAGMWRKIHSN